MKHYIDSNNKTYGFDETQTDLIPSDCVEIPEYISFDKYPFLSLVDGSVFYDQVKHEAKVAEIDAVFKAKEDTKTAALQKLALLGLTQDEVKAILE